MNDNSKTNLKKKIGKEYLKISTDISVWLSARQLKKAILQEVISLNLFSLNYKKADIEKTYRSFPTSWLNCILIGIWVFDNAVIIWLADLKRAFANKITWKNSSATYFLNTSSICLHAYMLKPQKSNVKIG